MTEIEVFKAGYVFPIPCLGKEIGEVYVHECFDKVREEVAEAQDALDMWSDNGLLEGIPYYEGESERLAEEIIDIITACTTCLERLGYDFDARQRMQMQVNEKNRKRGYHG